MFKNDIKGFTAAFYEFWKQDGDFNEHFCSLFLFPALTQLAFSNTVY